MLVNCINNRYSVRRLFHVIALWLAGFLRQFEGDELEWGYRWRRRQRVQSLQLHLSTTLEDLLISNCVLLRDKLASPYVKGT